MNPIHIVFYSSNIIVKSPYFDIHRKIPSPSARRLVSEEKITVDEIDFAVIVSIGKTKTRMRGVIVSGFFDYTFLYEDSSM